MRASGVLVGVCAVLATSAVLAPATGAAQQALKATGEAVRDLPGPELTLRPGPGLEELAARVAAVLELRTGHPIEVGEPPPPGVLEAVPAGHVALADTGEGSIRVVLGTPGGRSFTATVELDGARAPDARAVALAVEALRDEAVDAASAAPRASEPAAPAESVVASGPAAAVTARDTGAEAPRPTGIRRLFGDVDPLVFLRAYGGASTSSTVPMTGLGLGAGMCVQRECLVIAADFPLGVADGSVDDLRYRYMTFLSGFYSRPFSFGSLTPGASIGFLTRLGHFRRDMGLDDDSLDTDLGARGALEVAWEMLADVDLMAEGGADLTIDRHQVAVADGMATRGDRWTGWLQTAIRYRP